jgi:Saxitoxin biosynthesis operon protein SxtJ
MQELTSHDDADAPAASTRSFGLLFGGFLLFIALIPLAGHGSIRVWALVPAIAFLLVAMMAPVLLTSLLRLWLAFGALLARVVSPVAMGIIFFGVFSTYGRLLRLLGRDTMRRKREPALPSYWVERKSAERAVNFDNQF